MRVECGDRPALFARAGLAALLLAAPAHADGVYGTVQTQYQKSDVAQLLQNGSDQFFTSRVSRELWVRTVDLHHQSYLSPDLMLESNARMTDQSFLGTGDLTRTPQGSLRLLHPFFQLLASYQPASVRSSLASQSGLNADSSTSRKVTTRLTEALLNAHVGVPRWPQLDLSWASRVRNGAGASDERNVSRNARATFDRDHYSLYGGVTDQALSASTAGAERSTQQVWNGGGSFRDAVARTASVTGQYDLTDVAGRSAGIERPSTLSQSASLTGEWHPVRKLSNSATYLWHHVDFGVAGNPPQSDQEGSLLSRYTFNRSVNVTSGGGIRTVRTTTPAGLAEADLQKYVTAVAALDARVRRNWSLTGNASHTTNWDPGRGPYGAQTVGGSTRGQLARRLQFDGSLQVTATGDTSASAQRISNAWIARLQGNPLRTLMLAYSLRDQRVGPRLFTATTVSRGHIVDLMWRPAPPVQLVGSYTSTSTVPGNSARVTTQSLSAKIEPSSRWQWYGSWTHTDQRDVVSTAGQLSSRETATSRVQYQPSRALAASAGMSWTDPGRSLESKQLDLAITWSFGR